jgi:hypothetical protein
MEEQKATKWIDNRLKKDKNGNRIKDKNGNYIPLDPKTYGTEITGTVYGHDNELNEEGSVETDCSEFFESVLVHSEEGKALLDQMLTVKDKDGNPKKDKSGNVRKKQRIWTGDIADLINSNNDRIAKVEDPLNDFGLKPGQFLFREEVLLFNEDGTPKLRKDGTRDKINGHVAWVVDVEYDTSTGKVIGFTTAEARSDSHMKGVDYVKWGTKEHPISYWFDENRADPRRNYEAYDIDLLPERLRPNKQQEEPQIQEDEPLEVI